MYYYVRTLFAFIVLVLLGIIYSNQESYVNYKEYSKLRNVRPEHWLCPVVSCPGDHISI
jgi:hypothetical protein